MKRVLILRSNPVNPDPRVEKTARALAAHGYEVGVLAWDRSASLPAQEKRGTYRVERILLEASYAQGMGNLPQLLTWQRHLFKYLKKHRKDYDLIHACDFDTVLPALLIKFLHKKQVIYDIFDFYADHLRRTPGWIKKIIRHLDYWAISKADAVILVDDSRRVQIEGAVPRRLEVIYNSPEEIPFEEQLSQPVYAPLTIAYIGLLQVERGLMQLLEVIRNHPDWLLDLAGFGGDEQQIVEAVEKLPNVRWHGRVPYQTALDISNKADVLIATYDPSIENHRFSSPNKLFEAMMLSKPIIVAENTNIDRIIREWDCGQVVPYGDTQALEAALLKYSNSYRLRQEQGVNARAAYDEHYSWKKMSTILIGLYGKLTGQPIAEPVTLPLTSTQVRVKPPAKIPVTNDTVEEVSSATEKEREFIDLPEFIPDSEITQIPIKNSPMNAGSPFEDDDFVKDLRSLVVTDEAVGEPLMETSDIPAGEHSPDTNLASEEVSWSGATTFGWVKKILITANTDWYLYNFRFSLAHYLRDVGYDVVLLSPKGEYHHFFTTEGFRWIRWEVGRQTVQPLVELKALRELVDIYKQEKPDLVHHHTIKPVLYGSLAARMAGVPAVVNSITGRGYVFSSEKNKARLLRSFIKGLYRIGFKQPKLQMIFENSEDRDYFVQEKIIPSERCHLIRSVGVDPLRFQPSPEPPGLPVALFTGRMLWDKGVGVLVEAARILKSHQVVKVVIAGNPDPGNPESISVETLRLWEMEGLINYAGWRSDIENLYAESALVVVPTMYGEGVPTVLLEAAASGRPVVASDTPGCREFVEDGVNGLLVPAGDAMALALAIERLATNPPLRAEMGAQGREMVLANFTKQTVNDETLAVYRKAMA